MERFKRSFSFRKKKDHVPESHKPHQWQEDERKVRDGTCSFQVRYLGCIEVFESRGIQVCEEAVKALKSSKGKYQRAILYVSGDALRVVDEISKGLIVDQTIEKVSFCAPDRSYEKGFAYICRDGTTRRWMCHGFLAIKETGERLSHAVGCAFAICLERKQKREKESVTVTFNDKGTSFTRTGSFRQTTLTERLADPQSAIIAEPVPLKTPENPHAVQRPHASVDMLQRQNSFRGFQKLESSPFKRQLSLRLNELPSTLDRQQQFGHTNLANGCTVATIPEASPTKEKEEETISEMCQQLTQGLSALATTEDPFASAPNSSALLAATHKQNTSVSQNIPENAPAARDEANNPWAQPSFATSAHNTSSVSEADFWLNTATSHVKDPFSTSTTVTTVNRVTIGPSTMTSSSTVMNGSVQPNLPPVVQPTVVPIQQKSPWANDSQTGQASPINLPHRAPHLGQGRSHSVDTAEMLQHQKAPTLRELHNKDIPQFSSQAQNTTLQWSSSVGGFGPKQPNATLKHDPFDAAWAAKSPAPTSTNPFQGEGDATVTKTFEINL